MTTRGGNGAAKAATVPGPPIVEVLRSIIADQDGIRLRHFEKKYVLWRERVTEAMEVMLRERVMQSPLPHKVTLRELEYTSEHFPVPHWDVGEETGPEWMYPMAYAKAQEDPHFKGMDLTYHTSDGRFRMTFRIAEEHTEEHTEQ